MGDGRCYLLSAEVLDLDSESRPVAAWESTSMDGKKMEFDLQIEHQVAPSDRDADGVVSRTMLANLHKKSPKTEHCPSTTPLFSRESKYLPTYLRRYLILKQGTNSERIKAS